MNLTHIVKSVEKALRDNSSTILTAVGVSGTLTTAYLAAKASFKASRMIDVNESKGGTADDRNQRIKERTKLVWKEYIPAAISVATTIGCIIGGAHLGARKTAAAYSLLTVSERAFDEYKSKVVEQIGENKEKALRTEIAQDRVKNTPSPMLVSGSNTVLCYEMHTGRYFNSDMETLRKAQNSVNAQALRENEANLNDFYYLVGLPTTSNSGAHGWTSDRLMDLNFSTVLSDDNRPCIAFEYNYVKLL
jgi:PHD/YefM family antitoxin component YafN of YafNO toxin-antitoxin module